jgi:leucyl aminopeptidase
MKFLGKLNAETLAEVLKQKAEEVSMRVEVMNKEKIESLRWRLVSVNKGSSIPTHIYCTRMEASASHQSATHRIYKERNHFRQWWYEHQNGHI